MASAADDRRAALEVELALLDAEEKLVAAKAKKLPADRYRAIKGEVRDLRRQSRERRDAAAAASAAPVNATASAKSAGRD